ncbi:hypothetical protein CDD83_4709 [Cordyceps sp. RAO-2017]|nr:hypothetical protein CDD83_4709 [Cordyceps sp. RAO-2017]
MPGPPPRPLRAPPPPTKVPAYSGACLQWCMPTVVHALGPVSAWAAARSATHAQSVCLGKAAMQTVPCPSLADELIMTRLTQVAHGRLRAADQQLGIV